MSWKYTSSTLKSKISWLSVKMIFQQCNSKCQYASNDATNTFPTSGISHSKINQTPVTITWTIVNWFLYHIACKQIYMSVVCSIYLEQSHIAIGYHIDVNFYQARPIYIVHYCVWFCHLKDAQNQFFMKWMGQSDQRFAEDIFKWALITEKSLHFDLNFTEFVSLIWSDWQ